MEGDKKQWADGELLKLALSEGGKDRSVTIINYTIKPAVESGNNYCTQLFRVKVDYQKDNKDHTKSLIIKAPLAESTIGKSVIDEADLLKNEYIMYTNILPEIYTISGHKFGPMTYFSENEDILIMDDLTVVDYIMCNRLEQLDVHHCKQFLTTLAKYHAATVALHKQSPELVESNGVHPLYNDNMKNQALTFYSIIKCKAFVTVLQKLSGMEILAETIQSHGNHLRGALIETFKRRGPVNVLNHGDCWTNNIMFKYGAGGEILDCKLIDYQMRTYGSPAIDLVYFLFTSARREVRQEHMDEVLQLYCDTLNENLSKLDCEERLSLQCLREEIRQACPWALMTVILFLPMILNEPDELSDKLKDNEENLKSHDINVNPILRVYLGKTYNAVLLNVTEDLIKLGVIDCLKNIT